MLSSLLLLLGIHAGAQGTYLDRLTEVRPGWGVVTEYQSTAITDTVNGGTLPDTIVYDTIPQMMRKVRLNGYRIQVFSGGNSRRAKNEALTMQNRVRIYFDDIAVYTHFQSPHWICRVGDFLTIQEAREMLKQMRETGRFPEAVIVKSKVNAYQ